MSEPIVNQEAFFETDSTVTVSETWEAACKFLGDIGNAGDQSSSVISDHHILVRTIGGRIIAKFIAEEKASKVVWSQVPSDPSYPFSIPDDDLITAFKRRQYDKGSGAPVVIVIISNIFSFFLATWLNLSASAAYLLLMINPISIYYATSRRTITPFLWYLGLIPFDLFFTWLVANEVEPGLNRVVSVLIGIILMRLGIDSARVYAWNRLKNPDLLPYKEVLRNGPTVVDKTVDIKEKEGNKIFSSIPKVENNMDEIDEQLRDQAPTPIPVEKLKELKDLYEQKLISAEEYELLRKKALGL